MTEKTKDLKLTRAERRRMKKEDKLVAIHRGDGFTLIPKRDLLNN